MVQIGSNADSNWFKRITEHESWRNEHKNAENDFSNKKFMKNVLCAEIIQNFEAKALFTLSGERMRNLNSVILCSAACEQGAGVAEGFDISDAGEVALVEDALPDDFGGIALDM